MQNSNSIFTSYSEVISFLDRLGLFHMDFGLNRMYTAISALVPRSNMHIVQVLGTNGKGSTSSFLSQISITHGIKTGLYISPHFISPRERILINNQMIDESDWVHFANKIYSKIQDLTYFEFLTIMAYLIFHEAQVEVAIIEAGLGGQHDATTALPAHSLCYTPIDIDHQGILGNTLQAIAKEKALAIRSNAPIISAHQHAHALSCLKEVASKFDAPIHIVKKVSKDIHDLKLKLQGTHQKENAYLASKTWNVILEQNKWNINKKLVNKGLQEAFIAGRMQYIPANNKYPAFLLDGAHNCHGLLSLANSLAKNNYTIISVIFSCMADKDSKKIAELISEISNNKTIFIPNIPNNIRALDNTFLAALFKNNAIAVPSMNIALEHCLQAKNSEQNILNKNSEKPIILICGSLYLLAEFFKIYPEYLQNNI